jgi:hypothetical protein
MIFSSDFVVSLSQWNDIELAKQNPLFQEYFQAYREESVGKTKIGSQFPLVFWHCL